MFVAGETEAKLHARALAAGSPQAHRLLVTAGRGFADRAELECAAAAARTDGCAGMLAHHPAQVAAIDTDFAEKPGARGALDIDHQMIDRPHLAAAQ